jgi:hypothetical protein
MTDRKFQPKTSCADYGLKLTPQDDGAVLLEATGPARLGFDGQEALFLELTIAIEKARALCFAAGNDPAA